MTAELCQNILFVFGVMEFQKNCFWDLLTFCNSCQCSRLYIDYSIWQISIVFTTKRIWNRSIISSIKPKFDNSLFIDLHVLYKWAVNLKVVCHFCKSKCKHVHNSRKSTNNHSTNFGLIEQWICCIFF